MRRLGLTLGAAVVALGLGAGSAQAVFINGSVSISNGGITVSQAAGTTSIVSALTTLTQGAPVATSSSGDLAGAGAPTTANALVLSPTSGQYTVTVGGNVFTFVLTSVSAVTPVALHSLGSGTLGDSLNFNVAGTVTGGTFQSTNFGGTYSAQGSCVGTTTCNAGTQTASWSASFSATGSAPGVPEPASLALLGTALVGLGFARWRRKAA